MLINTYAHKHIQKHRATYCDLHQDPLRRTLKAPLLALQEP